MSQSPTLRASQIVSFARFQTKLKAAQEKLKEANERGQRLLSSSRNSVDGHVRLRSVSSRADVESSQNQYDSVHGQRPGLSKSHHQSPDKLNRGSSLEDRTSLDGSKANLVSSCPSNFLETLSQEQ